MAEKQIRLTLAGTETIVAIEASLSREELYGAQKITTEKDGIPLEKVIVTPWGELLSPKSFRNIAVDSEGALAEKPTPCDESGNPVQLHISSFKETRPIEPADWKLMGGFITGSVMPAYTNLPPGLYKTSFCYRDSTNLEDAFLLVKAEQAFLLTGELREVPLCGKDEIYEFFDEDGDAADDDDDDDGMGFDNL